MLGIWVIDAKMVSRAMDEKRLPTGQNLGGGTSEEEEASDKC